MAEKRKMGLETTCTRKKTKQQIKIRQTNDHLLGKRKTSTIGIRKKRKQNNDDYRDWAAGLPDHLLELDETNKNSTFDIPMRKKHIGSHIWGSYRDWLFLGRPFKKFVRITLRNPFSREKVVLPNTCNDYHMVVLSSVPSDPKCIFMLVHQMLGVAFWTSSAPREWRKCELMGSNRVVDALYHEGLFYLLKDTYEMVIIDEKSVVNMLNNTDEDNDESSLTTQCLQLRAPCSGYTRKYIVESNGDILLMCRIFHKGFETYRLDISEMAWVKLKQLGNNNQVVFLGKSCCRSFNTKEIGGGDDALANKIYFSNNSFTNRINEWENGLKPVAEGCKGKGGQVPSLDFSKWNYQNTPKT